jgi:hypothetical protein
MLFWLAVGLFCAFCMAMVVFVVAMMTESPSRRLFKHQYQRKACEYLDAQIDARAELDPAKKAAKMSHADKLRDAALACRNKLPAFNVNRPVFTLEFVNVDEITKPAPKRAGVETMPLGELMRLRTREIEQREKAGR